MKIYFIYVTCKNIAEAKKISGELVKNNLAACTNILPKIYSTFVWNNKIQFDTECSMIVKTSKLKVRKTIKFIEKIHSYDCPSISAFPIEIVSKDFNKWVVDQTKL